MDYRTLLTIAVSLPLMACAAGEPVSTVGTPADREALAQEIVAKTMARTAWSPYTEGRPERTFQQDAAALIPEFRAAATDHALLLALIKLSNLRHDRHLTVDPVDGGLQPPAIDRQAPIQFRVDYGTPGQHTLFVADYDRSLGSRAPAPAVGDVLTAVNDVAITEYARRMQPYLRYSTVSKLWWETATAVSRKTWRVGPELYAPGDAVRYSLRRSDGSTYTLDLQFQPAEQIQWAGMAAKRYDGFSRILETPSFDAFTHARHRVVILDWKQFSRTGPADIDRLMEVAQQKSLLDHAVFFDGTSSGGGSRGAYVLARLTARPFKTTFGNLRISDVTGGFIAGAKRARDARAESEDFDGGARLVDWLETDVTAAITRGDPYSPNVPFKFAEPDADANGLMQPAPVHFRGGLAASFSSFGGSHLDQFAAMVIDNKLGYTVGMPAGGYSNTWEWTETLRLPGSERPIASFMWNIGHTLRPNGEILEGNAATPDEWLPMTRDNFTTYHAALLGRVLAHFEQGQTDAPRRP